MPFNPNQKKPQTRRDLPPPVPLPNLTVAVLNCVSTFAKHPHKQFRISLHLPTRKWFVIPTALLCGMPMADPRSSALVLFHGDYSLLRDLAIAFPPDLLGCAPITLGDTG